MSEVAKLREKLFSVTVKDCVVQTFRSGGAGGQNQNKRDTGVRIIHPESGARGESREHRTQLLNKRAAWRRMADSAEFRAWIRIKSSKVVPVDALVDRQMAPENILVEVRENGRWITP